MTSFAGPIVLTPLLSYIKPQNYDWNLLKEIKQADDADEGTSGIIESSNHTGVDAEETMTTDSDAQMKAEMPCFFGLERKPYGHRCSLP